MVSEEDKKALEAAKAVLDKVDYNEVLEKIIKANQEAREILEKLERAKLHAALSGRALVTGEPMPRKKMNDVDYSKAFFDGKVKLNEDVPGVE